MKRIIIILCILLAATQVQSEQIDYDRHPILHQQYKDSIVPGTTKTRSKIKQLTNDPDGPHAFRVKRYNPDTGAERTDRLVEFSRTELQNKIATAQARITAWQYLLDPNEQEFKDASVIYNTIQFKANLTSQINSISTLVIDSNATAEINSFYADATGDLTTLYDAAEGSAKTAIGLLMGYIKTYTTALKGGITDNNCIAKVAAYKAGLVSKIDTAIGYANQLDGSGFKTPFLADIDAFDSYLDAKIVTMAALTTQKVTLNNIIDGLDEELVGAELTSGINSMEGTLISGLSGYEEVDLSDTQTAVQNIINTYEGTL